MGDIYQAYKTLNETFQLGLKPEQLAVAEKMVKGLILERQGVAFQPKTLNMDIELVAMAVPRRTPLTQNAVDILERAEKLAINLINDR